jgi:polysaccharide export outer membrane protein
MKHTTILILALTAVLASGCHSRELAYISDAQRDSAQAVLETYTATIMPGDQIYIYVESQTPESVIPFNQETHKIYVENNRVQLLDTTYRAVTEQDGYVVSSNNQYVTAEITGYFVSEKGTINFPILGDIMVAGITQDSLCHLIERRLKEDGYVNDPVVTSKLMNFRVTVVGEVNSPQQIHVQGTRLTILEAIAICGDLTVYGQRENLTIVRNDGGKQEIGEIDLTKKEMLDSPFYYLHNNDIVYVEPSNTKKRRSDRNDDVPRYIAIGVSVGSIIVTYLNTIRTLNQM